MSHLVKNNNNILWNLNGRHKIKIQYLVLSIVSVFEHRQALINKLESIQIKIHYSFAELTILGGKENENSDLFPDVLRNARFKVTSLHSFLLRNVPFDQVCLKLCVPVATVPRNSTEETDGIDGSSVTFVSIPSRFNYWCEGRGLEMRLWLVSNTLEAGGGGGGGGEGGTERGKEQASIMLPDYCKLVGIWHDSIVLQPDTRPPPAQKHRSHRRPFVRAAVLRTQTAKTTFLHAAPHKAICSISDSLSPIPIWAITEGASDPQIMCFFPLPCAGHTTIICNLCHSITDPGGGGSERRNKLANSSPLQTSTCEAFVRYFPKQLY